MLNTPHTEQPGPVQLFTHPSFGTIRTAGSADNPLFCLRDLCKTLGLDSSQVRKRLPDGVVTIHLIPDAKGRTQRTTFVSEPGMYKVIFQSRKPEAEAFTDWVTSEVLPSIHKNGYYGHDPASRILDRIERLLDGMEQRISALEGQRIAPRIAAQCKVPEESKGEWTLAEIARELKTEPDALKSLLVSIRLATNHQRVFTETKHSVGKGYFVNLPYPRFRDSDFIIVTEKGKNEIVSAFPTYKKQHPYI